jgi:polar amino acid transport system substrate-binding protein
VRNFGRFSWVSVIAMLLPSFQLFAVENQEAHIVIKFCAPQNDIYPFFVTENGNLTGINPNMMQQVFNQQTLPNVTLKFIKRPWKRCNSDLEKGIVDMMIGGFDANRKSVAYPSSLGFNLNNSVLSTADVCFFSIGGMQMERTKRGMKGISPFIVGIEAGFSKQHDSLIKPQWVELFNPIEKYKMLEKGRVDAIVQVCAMDGNYSIESMAETIGFSNFEALYPPYLSNPAYVVFSENFAENNLDLAKRIVELSLKIDKAQVYSQYQPKVESESIRLSTH